MEEGSSSVRRRCWRATNCGVEEERGEKGKIGAEET